MARWLRRVLLAAAPLSILMRKLAEVKSACYQM